MVAHPGGTKGPDQAGEAEDEDPEHEEHGPGDVEDEIDRDSHDDVHEVTVPVEDDGPQAVEERLAAAHQLSFLEALPASQRRIRARGTGTVW